MKSAFEIAEMQKEIELFNQEKAFKEKQKNEESEIERKERIRGHQLGAFENLFEFDLSMKQILIDEFLDMYYKGEMRPTKFMLERHINLYDFAEEKGFPRKVIKEKTFEDTY